jgi:osmotically-inducible protein OsmY
MAEDRLRSSSYLALRDVDCHARGDVVYLHGRPPSYFLKQIAQEIAAGVGGVRRVINRIDVRRPARHGAGRPG